MREKGEIRGREIYFLIIQVYKKWQNKKDSKGQCFNSRCFASFSGVTVCINARRKKKKKKKEQNKIKWEVREWKRLVLSPKLGTITHGTSPLGPRWEASVMPVYKTEKTNTSARVCMPVGTMGQLQGRTPRLIKTLGLIIKIRAEAPSTLGVVSHFSLVWVKDNSILTEKPGVKQIQLQSSFPQTEMLFKINQKDNAKLAN